MQFKRQGSRIQVLAYRGYDKDKRRAIVKMVGSLDGYSFTPSDGLIDSLTAEEKEELQSYIEKERQSNKDRMRQSVTQYVASQIKTAADSLTAGEFTPSDTWAAETWAAIDALSKAMRKAGHPRPAKVAAKATETPVERTKGANLDLPLADATEPPVARS